MLTWVETPAISSSTCLSWSPGARRVPPSHPGLPCKFYSKAKLWSSVPSIAVPRPDADRKLRRITGTPAGIGWGRKPKLTLHGGDEFAVEILPHIGSLYNVMEDEK